MRYTQKPELRLQRASLTGCAGGTCLPRRQLIRQRPSPQQQAADRDPAGTILGQAFPWWGDVWASATPQGRIHRQRFAHRLPREGRPGSVTRLRLQGRLVDLKTTNTTNPKILSLRALPLCQDQPRIKTAKTDQHQTQTQSRYPSPDLDFRSAHTPLTPAHEPIANMASAASAVLLIIITLFCKQPPRAAPTRSQR